VLRIKAAIESPGCQLQQHESTWPDLAAGPAGLMTLLREEYAGSEYAVFSVKYRIFRN
jgi:hypothetical protein